MNVIDDRGGRSVSIDPYDILLGVGLFFGGAVGGAISAIKTPLLNRHHFHDAIEKSTKTSGALHVSEEALDKIGGLHNVLKSEYLTKDKHEDICDLRQTTIKLYISNELKQHTKEILDAIKKNGNDHDHA
jgi:uncharacterized protein YnzC (UPF0291/DUF896 family)